MTDHRSEPENPSQEASISDREWIDRIRRELDPGVRSANERASFRMRIDEEIESRRAKLWQSRAGMAVAVVAAALLWFAMPSGLGDPADRPDDLLAAVGDSGFLSYAYYETDYLPSSESENSILSDEYQAIASVFDVP